MRISSTIKGVITAAVMIVLIYFIFNMGDKADRRLQYLVYITYALGILWAIMAHRASGNSTGKFGDLFSQGFKCFIVVALAMAIFYGVFNYQHPEFAEEQAAAYKVQLLEHVKEKKMLATDVDPQVATYKKQYTLKLVSGAIFGYLIIGAGVSAVVSALLMRRN